jgi:hypothetical protein
MANKAAPFLVLALSRIPRSNRAGPASKRLRVRGVPSLWTSAILQIAFATGPAVSRSGTARPTFKDICKCSQCLVPCPRQDLYLDQVNRKAVEHPENVSMDDMVGIQGNKEEYHSHHSTQSIHHARQGVDERITSFVVPRTRRGNGAAIFLLDQGWKVLVSGIAGVMATEDELGEYPSQGRRRVMSCGTDTRRSNGSQFPLQ